MLCEDDAEVSAALIRQLAGVGITARARWHAERRATRGDLGNYAAIIVDLNLPDGDGLDLIQQLRSRPQYHDKPIVVISANSKRGREDLRSLALGVLDWLISRSTSTGSWKCSVTRSPRTPTAAAAIAGCSNKTIKRRLHERVAGSACG